MAKVNKAAAPEAAAEVDQNVSVSDQNVTEVAEVSQPAAAVESSEQPVQEVAEKDQNVSEDDQKVSASTTVNLCAVYPLAVRHPDAVHADGRPIIISMHEAVAFDAYKIDPQSPERDQFLIDQLEAGYLKIAGL